MAVRQRFGHLSAGAARGLALRHDHGSDFMADDFQKQIRFWGVAPSYAFVGEPETNGVIERLFRTLKEQVVHGRIFQTIDEVRDAVRAFVVRYNAEWLIEKNGHRSPLDARAAWLDRPSGAPRSATHCPESRVRYTGTSFLRTFYMRWGQGAAAAIGAELAYEAASSDAGVAKATQRSVDFGACETPLSPGRLRERALIQFPSVFGAMVVAVNLPEVQQDQLRLTPDVLADLFLGKIAKWNDPRVAEHNRDLRLPDLAVVPIYRTDPAGTNYPGKFTRPAASRFPPDGVRVMVGAVAHRRCRLRAGGWLRIAGLAGCGSEGSAGASAPVVSRPGAACARERGGGRPCSGRR
jgi:hypothetical protein